MSLIRSTKRASCLVQAHASSYQFETIPYRVSFAENSVTGLRMNRWIILNFATVPQTVQQPFRLFGLEMNRPLSEIHTTRTFMQLPRNTPLFSSLEELHEKLTELLGKSFNVVRKPYIWCSRRQSLAKTSALCDTLLRDHFLCFISVCVLSHEQIVRDTELHLEIRL